MGIEIKKLDKKAPTGDIKTAWDRHCFNLKLVNPANRSKFKIIVVGTGLAGGGASAALAEMGFNIHAFTLLDSPRRSHSIAAQGGVNGAKNYPNDGDSVWRLFYDTVKGGDFRSNEYSVYRLSQCANKIIDHAVACGVPFTREYGGGLANRSFGGVQVSRTFYSRGQTGQQLLLGVYGSLLKEVHSKKVTLHTRSEMLDLVVIGGRARGIVTRNLVTGELETHHADAVILATGGFCKTYFLSTNAMASNGASQIQCYKKGAYMANPCFTQIHPTALPISSDHMSKQTLMSEALRNDGRIWVPIKKDETRKACDIPETERDYFLERRYPSFGNLTPRDITSRAIKQAVDSGHGVGPTKVAVYLDFKDAIERDGKEVIEGKYGNLFEMYHHITNENPYVEPMRIFPTAHFTMGGLWVDYNLMTSIEGLFAGGECSYEYHGANRLGANSLMSAMTDGTFVLPTTVSAYLGEVSTKLEKVDGTHPEFECSLNSIKERISKLKGIKGNKTADQFHRELGKIMFQDVGIERSEESLVLAVSKIEKIKKEFYLDLLLVGSENTMNSELEKALRVEDTIELGLLMARDALERKESCGAHYRQDFVDDEGEALRDDDSFCHVAAWEYVKNGLPLRHIEELQFNFVKLSTRSYK
ncbi:MAG: fumarate reductase/succinate dehydrogenase flavoprotein subunit [Bacteriovoracaceae bacterium]|jgi:succinate dehydrogenase / fumarate reductase, flavoprotein subunit|nr:fumarate reductase/succinate dehydrogenase flavoprotein subunit [Bacteriovoracaceae bacterium]